MEAGKWDEGKKRTPGSCLVSAHFHTSFPKFRSTCNKSTTQRSRPAEVKGTPVGPGRVPRCSLLCLLTKADRSFFPTSVSAAARNSLSFFLKASCSASRLSASLPKSQQSHGRSFSLKGSCARRVRSAVVARKSHRST
eukprot:6176966-Pleurochrysis_carterae.AAC.1